MSTVPHPVSLTAADLRHRPDAEERAERQYDVIYQDAYATAARRIREQIAAILRAGSGSIELPDEVGVRHTFNADSLFDCVVGHHAPDAWGILLGVAALDGDDARIAFRNAEIFRRDFESFIQHRARYAAQQAATLALIEARDYVD